MCTLRFIQFSKTLIIWISYEFDNIKKNITYFKMIKWLIYLKPNCIGVKYINHGFYVKFIIFIKTKSIFLVSKMICKFLYLARMCIYDSLTKLKIRRK